MQAASYTMGYATSGFAHHRFDDAVAILADLGYGAVSLTLDVVHLDPFAADLAARVANIAEILERRRMKVVVETGARFLLDPRRKHRPTLMDDGDRRRAFNAVAVRIARDLGADCVALWAGAKPEALSRDDAWARLVDGCGDALTHADRAGVDLAFEPEPGFLVETVAEWATLRTALGDPDRFRLCLDIGHLLATGEGDPGDVIRKFAPHIATAAIEDTRRGRHEHLPFGEGHLDVPSVLDALDAVGYRGILSVELSRHAFDAVNVATRARDILLGLGAPFRTPAP